MAQAPILSFESSAFPITDGEDDETNPGVFGRSLAEWLAKRLNERGIATTGVIAEDFGWCVAIASQPNKQYVACSSVEEHRTTWQVFAFSERGLFNRLLGKDKSAEALGNLHSEVKDILMNEPLVSSVKEEP
jgi:hypothetical protein